MSDQPKNIQQQIAIWRQTYEQMKPLADEGTLKTILQKISELEGQQTLIIEGDVNTQGGDFVRRDKIIQKIAERAVVFRQDAHGNLVVTGDGNTFTFQADEVPKVLLAAYLRSVAHECSRLPLGLLDPDFAMPGAESQVTLRNVYTDLEVVSPPRGEEESHRFWGMRLAKGEEGARTPVLEAIAQPDIPYLALLGEAGSGKSTFVNYLTSALSGQGEGLPDTLKGLLPIRLILRNAHIPLETGAGTEVLLWNALRADLVERLGEAAAEKVLPHLQERLFREGGLILLDGLDEVPEAGKRRQCLLEAIQTWVDTLPKTTRFLLTARPYAYADPKWHLPNFQEIALARFNPEQADRFIRRWYSAVRPTMGWDALTTDEKADQLAGAIRHQTYLADLAARPLLLTLMATLHTHRGKLPEDRADLYENSVSLLLSRWQTGRVRKDGAVEPGIEKVLGLGEARLRAAVEALAFQTHQRQGQDPAGREEATENASADIPLGEVLVAFSKQLPGDLNAVELVKYLEERAGLLVGRQEAVYAFLHRSFQEYLASSYLANTEKDFAARLKQLVLDDLTWWREVYLLGAGKIRQGGLASAVALLNHLVPREPEKVKNPSDTHWKLAILAAQAALELRLPEKALGDDYFSAMLDRLRDWLVALLEAGHLPPSERLQAGDFLGLLGDPRPGVGLHSPSSGGRGRSSDDELWGEGLPDITWIRIPAGPFTMGSPDDDEQAYADEKPAHPLELPEFWISQYPITNLQYRPFVEAGGYDQEKYWTPEGWAWRNGAEPDFSAIEVSTNKEAVQQYKDWILGRTTEKRNRPYWWNDPKWGAPTRPVVGISWYEAIAFCRWLNENRAVDWPDGQIGLPTEAEWEKAARGSQGNRWPWGNEFLSDNTNTEETGLGETNPVGMFPGGKSFYQVHDLAGNVWEWTRSKWGLTSIQEPDYRYPYDPSDGRETLDGPDLRVLRGGSWASDGRGARCAFRFRYFPVSISDNAGFRLVVSLAGSGF